MQKQGTLYLIPCPISEDTNETLPKQTINKIFELRHFIAERAKTTRRFIKTLNPPYQISELEVEELDKHGKASIDIYLNPLRKGKDVGLISEAGCPCIADPGGKIVAKAYQENIKVVPLVGPSSILLAMMASGMNGQAFTFHGYLPVKNDGLKAKLRAIESEAHKTGYAQIFMETPYRSKKIIDMVLKSLMPKTRLCIAKNITGGDEEIKTMKISEWQKTMISGEKYPAILIISS